MNIKNEKWASRLSSISIIGLGVLIVLLLSNSSLLNAVSPLVLWGIIALIMTILLIGLGIGATGKWYGVIVEKNRNRASLSRLQITLWTITIISAFLSMALFRIIEKPKEPSPSEIATCKTEYLSDTYDINISDLSDTTPADEQEDTSENQISLKQAMTEAEEECIPQALKIRFPEELLLVLGISTASFAGASLIKSNKQNKPSIELKRIQNNYETIEKNLEDTKEKLDEAQSRENASQAVFMMHEEKLEKLKEISKPSENGSPNEEFKKVEEQVYLAKISFDTSVEVTKKIKSEIESLEKEILKAKTELDNREDQGLLAVANEPKFTDIFYGDQEGDAYFIDLGKVQMFFITISILFAYGVAIGAIMDNTNLILAPLGVDFPKFSSSMTTLLGISHAGYLVVKTPDRALPSS